MNASPLGWPVPVTVATLVIDPSETSVAVATCDSGVHVMDAPGANVVDGQETEPSLSSFAAMLMTVSSVGFSTV